MIDATAIGRLMFGVGRATHITVGVWRIASVASGLALVAPIMLVGRRPYRLGRLADRLRAIQDMAVIPDALPGWLSWLSAAIVATVVGGFVTPVRYRRFHGVVAATTLVFAVLVRQAADDSDWTSPTSQLTVVVVLLAVAVVASALPASA